jgi:hypothetical protein
MTGEDIDDHYLMSLFEAARWASSSYNNQPSRFIYGKRNTESWNKFLICWMKAIKYGLKILQF